MNILITGGTGLIGKDLVRKLQDRNHKVRILTRSKSKEPNHYLWDIKKEYIDDEAFENLDSIIHLAGASVSERWTDQHKKEMFSSRIDAANLLKKYCISKDIHLKSFISASGINYYGTFTSDTILTENSGIIHPGYLAQLSEDWENAAHQFSDIADRIVCLRTSVVLAKSGGAFPLLKKTVDLNVGSAVGSGEQWMNWIHVDDLVNMYVDAVENSQMVGNFNAVADEVVSNKVFMKTLAEISDKIFLPLNVPAFVLKLAMGEMSSIILEGTRADNKKIKSTGFDFKYPDLREAFKSLM